MGMCEPSPVRPRSTTLQSIWLKLPVQAQLTRSESGVWLPSNRLSGTAALLHHPVNLLKGKTFGLPDKEVRVDYTDNASRAPDEEHLGLQVAFLRRDHVRSNDL